MDSHQRERETHFKDQNNLVLYLHCFFIMKSLRQCVCVLFFSTFESAAVSIICVCVCSYSRFMTAVDLRRHC